MHNTDKGGGHPPTERKDIKMTEQERQNKAIEWFFNGGYETMNELQQVEFLVDECGYTEEGAWDLVYGC